METSMNFGIDHRVDNGGFGRPPENFPLTRQSSIYSLTFDELMNSGSIGKDVESMNMDELLKNIWTVEELQTVVAAGARQEGAAAGVGSSSGKVLVGNLQRQGSLTLPGTLSQKTVEEVWKDISKEYSLGKNRGDCGDVGSSFPTRQHTFAEITLEEFLLRAGVREDTQLATKQHSEVFGEEFSYQGQVTSNGGLGFEFQQLGDTTGLTGTVDFPKSNDRRNIESSTTLPLDVDGVRSNLQQQQLHQPQSRAPRQHQLPIFPKQPAMPFANRMASPTGVQLSEPVTRNGTVGIVKSNDTSSVSPVPYMCNGGLRGRRGNGAVEKVVERRQKRMIKNRESAARSRARKQAYTVELEAEVAKLKEENQELQRKQEEMMEMQKNQATEMMNM